MPKQGHVAEVSARWSGSENGLRRLTPSWWTADCDFPGGRFHGHRAQGEGVLAYSSKTPNGGKLRDKLPRKEHEKSLAKLHGELVKLQEWIKRKGLEVCIVLEGPRRCR